MPDPYTDAIALRPHHALCIRHFVGHGYSPAFVENMTALIRRLREEPGQPLRITLGPDTLCAACPHNRAGICDSQEKVRRLDAAAAKGCGLSGGQIITWQALCQAVDRGLMPGGAMPACCAECEWYSLCEGLHHPEKEGQRLGGQ